jgi:hypothetical protein
MVVVVVMKAEFDVVGAAVVEETGSTLASPTQRMM